MPYDERFLRTLERLYLLARRRTTRPGHGERHSARRGASIEFRENRPYAPGDEVRYIDWNVYARHGALFVKEFSAEGSIHVTVFVDTSASMSFGTPSKMEAAREIAAAIGYIGLVSLDSITLYAVGERAEERRGGLRGKAQVFDWFAQLEELRASGRTDLRSVLAAAPASARGRALWFVISDFYDPASGEVLRAIRARGVKAHAVHVVAAEELDPALEGRRILVDLETGERRPAEITREVLDRYRRRFLRHCADLERLCGAQEVRYVRVRTDATLEERVMEIVRKGGILELR